MEEYKILKDLIKYNTINDNENEQIINYIELYLKQLDFKTEYKDKYLIMSIGEKYKIGFIGHTDTVEYNEGWNTNPFELTKKDNKLYGLGVCDMKGGIAAILEAVEQIDFTKLRYGMKLYFTYNEEIGFGGIYDIINLNEKFPNVMIIGEPTDNQNLLGSKGLLEYELNFYGKKAHSSNPEKGKSANINAVKFLAELNIFYDKEIKSFKEINYEVPYTTMNVGIINGGTSKNSVSANCKVTIDFRIANKNHIEIIKKKIKELAEKYDSDIKITEELEPFINEIEFINETKTANFITEASLIKESKRLILGAGPVTAHEINEHITIESYNTLIKQYKELIIKFCK